MATSAPSDDRRISVAGDVLASHVGDECVLLELKSGIYYTLDGAGAEVWKLVQTPTTIAAICDALTAVFDVDAEICRRDVRALVRDLADRALVLIDP